MFILAYQQSNKQAQIKRSYELYHSFVLLWCRCPVAVPGVRLAHGGAALHTDRCHSLASLDSATGGGRLTPQTLTCGSSPTGTKINPIVNDTFTMGFIGAGGRTRTGTLSPAVDFESVGLFGIQWNVVEPSGIFHLTKHTQPVVFAPKKLQFSAKQPQSKRF